MNKLISRIEDKREDRYSNLKQILQKNWYKILGLTLLLTGLFAVNFIDPISSSIPSAKLIFVALIDTLLLSYIVSASSWKGWRAWGAIFLLFYGIQYMLTAMESVYLSSILNQEATIKLLVNGAVVSATISAALIKLFGSQDVKPLPSNRLLMPSREWTWKIAVLGFAYLLLFILFGLVVYYPLARMIDPIGLALEQNFVDKSAAVWILPFEALRGMVWVLITVPTILALGLDKVRTALLVGLIFSLPMLDIFLSTNIAPGLQVAHFFELLGENFLFGVLTVWILGFRSRLP